MRRRDFSILVIDDDRDDAIMLSRALFTAGSCTGRAIHVEVAANGLEAIDLLGHLEKRRELPDVMTLDLNMPILDGVSVLKFLRATPALAGLKTIVVTTSSERMVHDDALRAGADDILVKPLSEADLRGMAEHVLRYC